jgi:hypothetical protein
MQATSSNAIEPILTEENWFEEAPVRTIENLMALNETVAHTRVWRKSLMDEAALGHITAQLLSHAEYFSLLGVEGDWERLSNTEFISLLMDLGARSGRRKRMQKGARELAVEAKLRVTTPRKIAEEVGNFVTTQLLDRQLLQTYGKKEAPPPIELVRTVLDHLADHPARKESGELPNGHNILTKLRSETAELYLNGTDRSWYALIYRRLDKGCTDFAGNS